MEENVENIINHFNKLYNEYEEALENFETLNKKINDHKRSLDNKTKEEIDKDQQKIEERNEYYRLLQYDNPNDSIQKAYEKLDEIKEFLNQYNNSEILFAYLEKLYFALNEENYEEAENLKNELMPFVENQLK